MAIPRLTNEEYFDRVQGVTEKNDTCKSTPGLLFIGFSGKKQVGKDTATDFAVECLENAGHTVHVTAFAEPLKRMCIDILGLDEKLVYGSNEDKDTLTHICWDNFPMNIRLKYSRETIGSRRLENVPRSGAMTVREVLQVVGTDIFREMFFDNIWAQAPFRKNYGDADIVILTDCRFPNEKEEIEGNEGVTVRLERNTGLEDSHRSETALDGYVFNRTYENNGTIDELHDFIRSTLEELKLL